MLNARTLLRLLLIFIAPITMAGCKSVTSNKTDAKSKSKRPAFTLRDSRAVDINSSLDRQQ